MLFQFAISLRFVYLCVCVRECCKAADAAHMHVHTNRCTCFTLITETVVAIDRNKL